jgi:hypothetical protein
VLEDCAKRSVLGFGSIRIAPDVAVELCFTDWVILQIGELSGSLHLVKGDLLSMKRLNLPTNYTTQSVLAIITMVIITIMLLSFNIAHLSAQSISQGGGGSDPGTAPTLPQLPSGGTTTASESRASSHSNTLSLGQIDFSRDNLVASFRVDGLYNLVGLGTWNGQPVSPTNMPSDDNRRLASTINFYVLPSDKNILYVQVTDVLTTIGAWWTGTAFTNVTQTGVRFTLPLKNTHRVINSIDSFSIDFANPSETLVIGAHHGTNSSNTEVTEPLSSTPGYTINVSPNGEFLIQTTNGAEYGFTSLGGIFGATRIRGGGVFQITFDHSLNLSHRIDFSSMVTEAQYGVGNQYIVGTRLIQ